MNDKIVDLVFDIDETIVDRPYYSKEKEYLEKYPHDFISFYLGEPHNQQVVHYVYNYISDLFTYLGSMENVRISFCSSGVKERNVELLKLLKTKLSGTPSFYDIAYKVISREELLNTELIPHEEREKYQPKGLFGNLKKDLTAIDPDNLQNTFLIDDDQSYVLKGQEKNFIKKSGYLTDYIPEIIPGENTDKSWSSYDYPSYLYSKNFPAWLLGILHIAQKAHEIYPDHTLRDILYTLQVRKGEAEKEYNYYSSYTHEKDFYLIGELLMQTVNPDFALMYFVPEENVLRRVSDRTNLTVENVWDHDSKFSRSDTKEKESELLNMGLNMNKVIETVYQNLKK